MRSEERERDRPGAGGKKREKEGYISLKTKK